MEIERLGTPVGGWSRKCCEEYKEQTVACFQKLELSTGCQKLTLVIRVGMWLMAQQNNWKVRDNPSLRPSHVILYCLKSVSVIWKRGLWMNWIKSTSELATALRELAADANRKQKTGSRFKVPGSKFKVQGAPWTTMHLFLWITPNLFLFSTVLCFN